MQSAFISVYPIRDVYTAEKRQHHFLSSFCLDCDFPPSSLTQFGLRTQPSPSYHFFPGPRVNLVHTAISFWVSDRRGLESKCCVALFAFPFTPLSCPRRGFCCCISAFLLCVQEVREQTSECFDSCSPSPETNMRTEHRQRRSNEAEEMLLGGEQLHCPLSPS